MLLRDTEKLEGLLDSRGEKPEATEFDDKCVNQVIHNGHATAFLGTAV
jgi:hypothetical protein